MMHKKWYKKCNYEIPLSHPPAEITQQFLWGLETSLCKLGRYMLRWHIAMCRCTEESIYTSMHLLAGYTHTTSLLCHCYRSIFGLKYEVHTYFAWLILPTYEFVSRLLVALPLHWMWLDSVNSWAALQNSWRTDFSKSPQRHSMTKALSQFPNSNNNWILMCKVNRMTRMCIDTANNGWINLLKITLHS